MGRRKIGVMEDEGNGVEGGGGRVCVEWGGEEVGGGRKRM